jgi:3-oxoacyl-[acyl-carrier protein] reductase
VSVLKSLSKRDLERKVTYINIAPGPTETDRLKSLAAKEGKTLDQVAESLPTKRISDPDDIGRFVKAVVESKIKAINGVSINFDMGLSNSLL